jgi:hypothetical protein
MAAKIKLGERPKNFKKLVKFPLLDGTEGAITCVYKYRTRSEFGAFIDGVVEAAQLKPALDANGEAKSPSMAELMEKTAGANADYILKVIEGWDLEETLSHASVQELSDTYPAAAAAIMETYRAAITEGRLGN